MAVKTKDFNVVDYDFSTDKEITITKKHTALRIDSMTLEQASNATYKIQGGKLVITSGGHSLTVSNYQGIKYIKTDFQQISKKKSTFNLYDIISENKVDNSSNPITQFNAKKFTAISGTNYNDTFDFYDGYTVPTEGKNKDRGLTIKGGNGSDTITGTKGNDKIIGGAGENIINVYTAKTSETMKLY